MLNALRGYGDPRGRSQQADKNDVVSMRAAVDEKDQLLKDMKTQYATDIGQLKQEIENFNTQKEKQLKLQKDSYEQLLKKKDDEIAQLKKSGGGGGGDNLMKYLPEDNKPNKGDSEKKSSEISDRKESDSSQDNKAVSAQNN